MAEPFIRTINNKIGNLSANGITESSAAEAIKNLKYNSNKLDYKCVNVSVYQSRVQDFNNIFTHLATQGADCILCPMTYLADITSSTFQRLSQSTIQNAIDIATSKGVKVKMIKPHITSGSFDSDSFDRDTISPSDEQAWFTAWESELKFYASICTINNIPLLCVTCEQSNQTKSSTYSRWQTLINNVKTSYPSIKLTAALTYFELNRAVVDYHETSIVNNICNLLDYIGFNIYSSYSNKVYVNGNILKADIDTTWETDFVGNSPMTLLRKAYAYYSKFLFITEFGCMHKDDALISVIATGSDNYNVQALLYQSCFDVPCQLNFLRGVGLWSGEEPFKYFSDAQILPSEQILINYFKGGIL